MQIQEKTAKKLFALAFIIIALDVVNLILRLILLFRS